MKDGLGRDQHIISEARLLDLIEEQAEKMLVLETEVKEMIKTEISKHIHTTSQVQASPPEDLCLDVPNDYDSMTDDYSVVTRFVTANPGTKIFEDKEKPIEVVKRDEIVLFRYWTFRIGGYNRMFLGLHTRDEKEIENILVLIDRDRANTISSSMTLCSKYKAFMVSTKAKIVIDKYGWCRRFGLYPTFVANRNKVIYDYYEYSTGPYSRFVNLICNIQREINPMARVSVTLGRSKALIEISPLTRDEMIIRIQGDTLASLMSIVSISLDIYNSFNNVLRLVRNKLSIYLPMGKGEEVDLSVSYFEHTSLCYINKHKYARCQGDLYDLYVSISNL